MLVLKRQQGEKVVIQVGSEIITVAVVELRSGRIRLGFDAAPHVVIHRQEVFDAIQRSHRAEAGNA